MKTLDQILAERRSVRSFLPEPVRRDQIVAICEAARSAPSACNSQTWRFIAVTDREVIQRISNEAMRPVIRNKWLSQAPLLIVGCSQLDIVANRLGKKITGIEYYQIDLGIAMEHMVLKATDLGLGTCWIGWFHEAKVKEILEIPGKIKVSAMLAVGLPENEPPKKRNRKPIQKIVYIDKWGKSLDP
jgi:nitroreductase